MTWEIRSAPVEALDAISLEGGWEPFAVDRGTLFVRRLGPDAGEIIPMPSKTRCEVCGGQIDSEDMLDLGRIRFRKNLCRRDFERMKDRRD